MGHRRQKPRKKKHCEIFRARPRKIGAIQRAFLWVAVAALVAAPVSIFVGGA